jgi:hypothetical protein
VVIIITDGLKLRSDRDHNYSRIVVWSGQIIFLIKKMVLLPNHLKQ